MSKRQKLLLILQDKQQKQVVHLEAARYGVQQAELAKNLQDIKSKRIFEDLSRNFMQAQQADIATSEAARARQLQAAPVYGQLGQGIGNLGGQQFGLGQQGIGTLLSAGQIRAY